MQSQVKTSTLFVSLLLESHRFYLSGQVSCFQITPFCVSNRDQVLPPLAILSYLLTVDSVAFYLARQPVNRRFCHGEHSFCTVAFTLVCACEFFCRKNLTQAIVLSGFYFRYSTIPCIIRFVLVLKLFAVIYVCAFCSGDVPLSNGPPSISEHVFTIILYRLPDAQTHKLPLSLWF